MKGDNNLNEAKFAELVAADSVGEGINLQRADLVTFELDRPERPV